MKSPIHIHTILIALALPLTGFAQGGKPEEAGKNPPAPAPAPGLADPVRVPNAGEIQPGKPADNAKTPAPVAEMHEFMGKITALSRDESSITINDAKMGEHKLHISETTKIMHGDKAAKWDELKVGQKVQGTCDGKKEMSHAFTLTIKD